MEIKQVLCPSCHGAQSTIRTGDYECEFCLTAFSVAESQRAEQRQRAQDEGWLEQRLGGPVGVAGADMASRAIIFRKQLLPDLRRDVDRALEDFTNYRQHALVLPPVPVPAPKTQSRNPLIAQRSDVFALANLRARLAHDGVLQFAMQEQDQSSLQGMERRIADVVHLSNVADAGSRRNELGYGAARRNLEAIIIELDESLAAESGEDGLVGFLSALRARYAAMAEFARICAEACSSNPVAGAELAGRLEELATGLGDVANDLQALPYDASETMPCSVGVQTEAGAMRVFARWLRSYDIVTARSMTPFLDFLVDIERLCTCAASSPEGKADLLEATSEALLTMRGERDAPVIDDFSWVDTWAETGRAKKTWGLFGNEEKVERTVRFLAPVWVAEIGYSASTGAVFKEGIESKMLALMDACATDPGRVRFLDGTVGGLADALGHTSRLASTDIALPRTTAQMAGTVFGQAAKARPNMLNARVRIRGLAWLPTAVAEFSSPKGGRAAMSCMNGAVALGDAAVGQVDAARLLVQRFG